MLLVVIQHFEFPMSGVAPVLRLRSLLHLLNLRPFLPHVLPPNMIFRGKLCVVRRSLGHLVVVSALLVVHWQTKNSLLSEGRSNM